jgi:drug/metabolite transporter (DMT)-like permease
MMSKPLLFDFLMAGIDAVVLSLLKLFSIGSITSYVVFILAFIIYGCQPFIFYYGLRFANLTVMNLMWDLASDILIAYIGLMIFKEKISNLQKIGILFGLVSLVLLANGHHHP